MKKLRVQVSECELIRADKLAKHFKVLADEVERAIAKAGVQTGPGR